MAKKSNGKTRESDWCDDWMFRFIPRPTLRSKKDARRWLHDEATDWLMTVSALLQKPHDETRHRAALVILEDLHGMMLHVALRLDGGKTDSTPETWYQPLGLEESGALACIEAARKLQQEDPGGGLGIPERMMLAGIEARVRGAAGVA